MLAMPRMRGGVARSSGPVQSQTSLGLLGFVLWALGLAAIFWFPFDFNFERGFLREQAASFFHVPLHAYYVSTPYRAVTEFLHKTLLFIPLGSAIAYARIPFSASQYRRIFDIAAVAAVGLVAVGIELGQMAVVGKLASSTDLVLEWLGGLIGYVGFVLLARRWSEHSGPTPPTKKLFGVRHAARSTVLPGGSLSREYDLRDDPSTYVQLHAAYAPFLQAGQHQSGLMIEPEAKEIFR
jgi:glycopeptide antibiotics resistance protein